jgi:hypothetical protein
MIHVLLPSQYGRPAGARLGEPHRRLMAAVLQAVVDDCRGGSAYRQAAFESTMGKLDVRSKREAVAYVASTDRGWPFSFENLCEALGLDPADLRNELNVCRGRPAVARREPLAAADAGGERVKAAAR